MPLDFSSENLFPGLKSGEGKATSIGGQLKQTAIGAGKSTLNALDFVFSTPQKAAVYGVEAVQYATSGFDPTMKPKFERPSEALGVEGGLGLAADIALDPLWFVGAPGAAAKTVKLGKEFGPLAGKTVTKEFLEAQGTIRRAATDSVIRGLEQQGYKRFGDSVSDLLYRGSLSTEQINEIGVARRTGTVDSLMARPEYKDVLIETSQTVDKLTVEGIQQLYKEGTLAPFLTSTGSEVRAFETAKWFDNRGITLKIPFTEMERTLVTKEAIDAGITNFKKAFDAIPGATKLAENLGKVFDYTGGAERGLVDIAKQSENTIERIVFQHNQLNKELATTIKQVIREGGLDETSKALLSFDNLNTALKDGTFTSEMAHAISPQLGQIYDKFDEMNKYLEKAYATYYPELKGRRYGQYITEETKQFMKEDDPMRTILGTKILKTEPEHHRQWFRFENAKGEVYWGKPQDKGLTLLKESDVLPQLKKSVEQLTDKNLNDLARQGILPGQMALPGMTEEAGKFAEIIKKKEEVIAYLEKKLADPKGYSFVDDALLSKIKSGEVELTELDTKLYQAYSEMPDVLNEAARTRLGKDKDFKLFIDDYFQIKAMDASVQARAVSNEQLAKTFIESDYIQKVTTGGKVPDGWEEVKWLGDSKAAAKNTHYYAARENARFLNRTRDILFTNEGTKAVYDSMKTFTAWWKSWTLGIFPSYHARNVVDDGFRMMLAGDMSFYDAFISPYKDGYLRMVRQFNKGEKFDEAIKIGQYTEEEAVNLASKHGVISQSVRDFDMADQLAGGISVGKVGGLLTPGVKNTIVQKGFEMGNVLENSRRLAMFADKLQKGYSPTQAAAFVRKVMFDYGELTDFEKILKSTFLPFYTFTSKATQLYLKELIASPGKYAALHKLSGDLDKNLLYEGEVPLAIPQELSNLFDSNSGKQYFINLSNYVSAISIPNQIMNFDNTFMNMLNPIIKGPIELTTDYDIFKGRQNYRGEMVSLLGLNLKKRSLAYQMMSNFRPIKEIDSLMRDATDIGTEMPLVPRLLKFGTGIKFQEFDAANRLKYFKKKAEVEAQTTKAYEKSARRLQNNR